MSLRSPYDRQILHVAVPALGALAAEPLYVLIDTAVVGHLGRSHVIARQVHLATAQRRRVRARRHPDRDERDGRYLPLSMVAAFVACGTLAVAAQAGWGVRGVSAALAVLIVTRLTLMGARLLRRRWLVTGFA